MSKNNGLNHLWRKHGIERILFFTYSFNFQWFHNQVLPRIRHRASKNTEILVISTRDDTDDYTTSGTYGDQYTVGNWCEWQYRFKVLHVDKFPMYHCKFILTEYQNEIEIGLGSANLTPSGWSRNIELWDWEQANQAGNIERILEQLLDKGQLPLNDLKPFMSSLKKLKPSSKKILPWPLTPQEKDESFKRIAGLSNDLKIIRIVSPYFGGADKLIAKIQEIFPSVELEIWFDGSGEHSKTKDLEQIIDLLNSQKGIKVKTAFIKSVSGKLETPATIPLHAKLVEFISSSGDGQRVFGSANATFAAWFGTNIESYVSEKFKNGAVF